MNDMKSSLRTVIMLERLLRACLEPLGLGPEQHVGKGVDHSLPNLPLFSNSGIAETVALCCPPNPINHML